jgi:hypothetical protein
MRLGSQVKMVIEVDNQRQALLVMIFGCGLVLFDCGLFGGRWLRIDTRVRPAGAKSTTLRVY